MQKKQKSRLLVRRHLFLVRGNAVALTHCYPASVEAQREASQKQGVTLNAADLEEYRMLYVCFIISLYSSL